MTTDQLAQMDQLISTAQSVLVVCHKSPDGDAIGSSLGMAEYLRLRGKDVTVVVPDQYPDFLHWLPNSEKIVRYDKHPSKCDMLFKIADLIVCLDFNTPSRVEDMEPALVSSPARKILIDHHLKPDVDADLVISQPEASSASELVFRVVWQLGGFPELGKAFAIPVYCGMMTDTGGFTFNSTRPEIFFIPTTAAVRRFSSSSENCSPSVSTRTRSTATSIITTPTTASASWAMSCTRSWSICPSTMPPTMPLRATSRNVSTSSRAMPRGWSIFPSKSRVLSSPSPCARIRRNPTSCGCRCALSTISPATS